MMISPELEEHEMVGLDADTAVCSCGDVSRSHIEHLGEVALATFGLRPRPRPAEPREHAQASPMCDRIDRIIWHGTSDRDAAELLFVPPRIIRARRRALAAAEERLDQAA